jgi:FdhE protein
MNMSTVKMKTQEEIEKSFFHIPFWISPANDLFTVRGERFTALASEDETDWKSYLLLLARVCDVQQALLRHDSITAPVVAEGSVYTLPDIHSAHIPAAFHTLLVPFYDQLKADLSPKVKEAWQKLLAMSEADRAALAERVLRQEPQEEDAPYAIWVHAVLQIIWTRWATQLKEVDVPTREEREYCPCCGSDAVGGIIINGGELEGLRYLQCNLCNGRWHALRAKCTFCANTKDMSFHSIEGQTKGVLHGASAECCEACHGYRKTYNLAKEQYADVVADDLASLPVDILLADKGFLRGGINPYLILDEDPTH